MLHGAGIFTYIWMIFRVNLGKYSSTMEHLGIWLPSGYVKIAIEHGQFIVELPIKLKMVIFNSYVSGPEGVSHNPATIGSL